MARQWRIEYKNAIYHVLSRGNQQQFIFDDDHDRKAFIDILADATERFSIDLYSYVLMGNHYHLLLKTVNPNLSKTMQWIGTTYTRRYNNRHGLSGHLFQERFKSIIVENDAYLLQLSYYIHRNPSRAGIVKRLADYSWSSHNYYAYKKNKPDWLNIDCILSQLRSLDKHREYRLMVQKYSDEKSKIWEDVKHGLIYGSKRFINKIKSRYMKSDSIAELPQYNRLMHDIDSDKFRKQAKSILGLDMTDLTKSTRLPMNQKEKRDMLIYYLIRFSIKLKLLSSVTGSVKQLCYNSLKTSKYGGYYERFYN